MHLRRTFLTIAMGAATSINTTLSFAADKYWVCGDGLWNNSACWSNTNGGIGGASIPFFDNVYNMASAPINTPHTIGYVDAHLSAAGWVAVQSLNITGNTSFGHAHNGRLFIENGTMLTTDRIALGFTNAPGAYGAISQAANTTVTVQQSMSLGAVSGSKGVYTNYGTFTSTSSWTPIKIGEYGEGSFEQYGSANTGEIYIGASSGGIGRYAQIAGNTTSSNMFVGSAGGTGTFVLQGGGLNTRYTMVGYTSNGSFTQSGGVHTATYGLYVGVNDGGNGVYTQTGGSTITERVDVGGGYRSTGSFLLQGGTLTSSTFEVIGGSAASTGSMSQSGGNNTAETLTIGAYGSGSYTQSGGNTRASTIYLGAGGSSSGVYNLQGGMLEAGIIKTMNAGIAHFNFTGGVLSVDTFEGNLANNGGTLSPGASPGLTHVIGNYTQAAHGNLHIELAGTDTGLFDRVDIDGTATLSGVLDVNFWNGFTGQAGDSFTILSAHELVGGFTTVNLSPLEQGLMWQMDYLYDQDAAGTDYLRLSIASSTPEPGTYAMMLAGLGMVGWANRRHKIRS